MITSLVNLFADEEFFYYEGLIAAVFERSFCSYSGIKGLDSRVLSKVYLCIRRNTQFRLTLLPCEQFIKVFLETENDLWLPLAVYVSLIQGSAVTVRRNSIVI